VGSLATNAQTKAPEAGVDAGTAPPATPRKQTTSAGSKPQKAAQPRRDVPASKASAQATKRKPAETVAKAQAKPAQPVQTAAPSTEGMTLAANTVAPQTRYGQCLELSSFLSRERCKWQVCNGKWGQEGCPSYETKEYIN